MILPMEFEPTTTPWNAAFIVTVSLHFVGICIYILCNHIINRLNRHAHSEKHLNENGLRTSCSRSQNKYGITVHFIHIYSQLSKL